LEKYQVVLQKSVVRFLKKIDKKSQLRLAAAIELLRDNPRPPKAKKLTNEDLWRVRVGDYRIIYQIEDEILTIHIIKIGLRNNVYKFKGN
jgi:mRNA interferase RelE/StbE